MLRTSGLIPEYDLSVLYMDPGPQPSQPTKPCKHLGKALCKIKATGLYQSPGLAYGFLDCEDFEWG